jgi:predicted ATPase with chaperone activity
MNPDITGVCETIVDKVNVWEENIRRYDNTATTPMNDDIKTAIALQRVDKQHLLLVISQ